MPFREFWPNYAAFFLLNHSVTVLDTAEVILDSPVMDMSCYNMVSSIFTLIFMAKPASMDAAV